MCFWCRLFLPYRVLASVSPDNDEGIVELLDVETEKVVAGEVLATLEATVCVEAGVVRIVLGIGLEQERLPVRRQSAPHDGLLSVSFLVGNSRVQIQFRNLGNGPQVHVVVCVCHGGVIGLIP
jgi:hypothetical protein